MISNLIVTTTLFLGALFTALYVVRPAFRARIEQPKHAFLEQLSMYHKGVSVRQGYIDSESSAGNDQK